jgi:hypothetical protein
LPTAIALNANVDLGGACTTPKRSVEISGVVLALCQDFPPSRLCRINPFAPTINDGGEVFSSGGRPNATA